MMRMPRSLPTVPRIRPTIRFTEPRPQSFFRARWPLFAAGAFGALVMYLLDPTRGRRRRALLRDRSMAAARDVGWEADRKRRFYAGKYRGAMHHLGEMGETRSEEVMRDDATLKQKIESEILRDYDTSRINLNVDDGIAELRGKLAQAKDIRKVVSEIERVPGIVEVRNMLEPAGRTGPGGGV